MSSREVRHPDIFEKATQWIGSVPSILTHTIVFAASFILAIAGWVSWSFMLLILTTVLSLEAIYLAIFIQLTVNRHTESLREVEEDIDEIQEDVEEISEDVEDIQEDIEEISEDDSEEERKRQHAITLETMTKDIQRLLADLERLKQEK